MEWSIQELDNAREVIGSLLDELHLKAYVFGVEPQNDGWKIQLDCTEEAGWRTVELQVEKKDLDDCPRDPDVRRRVLTSWRTQLKETTTERKERSEP